MRCKWKSFEECCIEFSGFFVSLFETDCTINNTRRKVHVIYRLRTWPLWSLLPMMIFVWRAMLLIIKFSLSLLEDIYLPVLIRVSKCFTFSVRSLVCWTYFEIMLTMQCGKIARKTDEGINFVLFHFVVLYYYC